jgi:hypothetical protein
MEDDYDIGFVLFMTCGPRFIDRSALLIQPFQDTQIQDGEYKTKHTEIRWSFIKEYKK